MLRSLLFATTVLAALPAAAADFSMADSGPTADEQRVSALLDVQGGYSAFDSDFGSSDATHFDIAGRVNVWLNRSFSLQFDAWDEEAYFESGDASMYGGAVHVSARDPSSYLLGALFSVGDSFGGSYANAAGEGQVYFGNLTVYAQAGYSYGYDNADGQTMPYVHLALREFLNPDLMLEAQGGYGSFDFGPGTTDVYRWEARIEGRVPRTPLSAYVAYQGMHEDFGSGFSLTENAIVGGLRLMTAGSLLENDRNGATLVDYNPLFGYPTWRD
jgi:hypothetical protein